MRRDTTTEILLDSRHRPVRWRFAVLLHTLGAGVAVTACGGAPATSSTSLASQPGPAAAGQASVSNERGPSARSETARLLDTADQVYWLRGRGASCEPWSVVRRDVEARYPVSLAGSMVEDGVTHRVRYDLAVSETTPPSLAIAGPTITLEGSPIASVAHCERMYAIVSSSLDELVVASTKQAGDGTVDGVFRTRDACERARSTIVADVADAEQSASCR